MKAGAGAPHIPETFSLLYGHVYSLQGKLLALHALLSDFSDSNKKKKKDIFYILIRIATTHHSMFHFQSHHRHMYFIGIGNILRFLFWISHSYVNL